MITSDVKDLNKMLNSADSAFQNKKRTENSEVFNFANSIYGSQARKSWDSVLQTRL